MPKDILSDEDKALFRAYVRDVSPLGEKKSAPPKQKHFATQKLKDYYLSDYIQDTVSSESILSYSITSLPKKRLQDLKRGSIPWQARLDLHGLKSEDAKEALCRFIQWHSQNNSICVLIVHGKGGQQGLPPVIKNLVHRWLPQLDEILAYHSALPRDGGAGALYTLLKRYPLAL